MLVEGNTTLLFFSLQWCIIINFICFHHQYHINHQVLQIVSIFFLSILTMYEGEKQHVFIIVKLWRSEVWNGSHLAKLDVLAGLRSFWKLERRVSFLSWLTPLSKPADRIFTNLSPDPDWHSCFLLSLLKDTL